MEGLRLKTVLTLVLEDYPDGNLRWCEERDVQFMVCWSLDPWGVADGIAIWYSREQGRLMASKRERR